MNSFLVTVSHKNSVLLNEMCDGLSEAHMKAKEVAVDGAVVEIWEGFVGADRWFDPHELIFSYKFNKEDEKDV